MYQKPDLKRFGSFRELTQFFGPQGLATACGNAGAAANNKNCTRAS